jgi:flagellar export protein FliJ
MKKFVFTLQKLYDVKAAEEEQKRIELKDLDAELADLKNMLKVLTDSFDKQKREFERACEEGLHKDDLKNFGDYFNYLNERIMDQQNRIADCEERIETCRQQLLRLINEQKVLDQMRQDQLQEYNAEAQKSYDKEIEDFMQSRM